MLLITTPILNSDRRAGKIVKSLSPYGKFRNFHRHIDKGWYCRPLGAHQQVLNNNFTYSLIVFFLMIKLKYSVIIKHWQWSLNFFSFVVIEQHRKANILQGDCFFISVTFNAGTIIVANKLKLCELGWIGFRISALYTLKWSHVLIYYYASLLQTYGLLWAAINRLEDAGCNIKHKYNQDVTINHYTIITSVQDTYVISWRERLSRNR